jgi:hypothetical protein
LIQISITGEHVCKSFYRAATGLSRQVFDAAVYHVMNNEGPPDDVQQIKVTSDTHAETVVCGFLDAYFRGFRVQYDPVCNDKAMLYQTWKELYEKDFQDYCKKSNMKAIGYEHFCAIRKSKRKNYVIAKSYRKKCNIFVLLMISFIKLISSTF